MVGGAAVGVDDHRVLHARARAVLQRQLRELVRDPQVAVELERVPGDLPGALKQPRALGQVEHVDRHGPLARDPRARRRPHVVARRRPGEVVDQVGVEAPREPVADGRRLARAALVLTDDDDLVVGRGHGREPRPHGLAQDLVGVLQRARRADQPAAGHVQGDVEGPEVVVELRGTEVGRGHPSVEVVVLAEPREPLRRLEQGVVPPLRHPVTAAALAAGQLGAPVDLYLGPAAGRDRLGQQDRRHGAVEPGRPGATLPAARPAAVGEQRHVAAVDGDPRHHHPFGLLGRDRRAARHPEPKQVVVEPQVEAAQLVAARVVDRDRLAAVDRLGLRVETRADVEVGAQLPVVRPRPTVERAGARREAAPDRPGQGDLAPDRPPLPRQPRAEVRRCCVDEVAEAYLRGQASEAAQGSGERNEEDAGSRHDGLQRATMANPPERRNRAQRRATAATARSPMENPRAHGSRLTR